MLIKLFASKILLFYFFVLSLQFNFFSQQHTFTSFSPNFAGNGDVVTLRGTYLIGVTSVTFGGTAASSFTIVNSTTIRAIVGAGTSGNVVVTKTGVGAPNRLLAGFNYSTLPTVTEIITDYGSFWKTSTTTNSPIWPDNSHNLLSFTYKNTTYSTGVNDGTLISNGISFTAGNFKALPVELNGITKGSDNLIVAGSKVDGNSTTAIYTHNNIKDLTMQSVVIDGIKGLDLGTGYTNLPTGASSNYFITNINISKIADDEPDIIVTQIAEPTGTATDTYRFLDASNNVVGNSVQVSLSELTALGTYRLDLFTVAAGQGFADGKPNAVWNSGTNSTRPIRFVGFRLSDFGVTGSNYALIKTLQITPSGVSDVAFVAYNANAIDALPVVQVDVTTTNSIVCGGGLGGSAQLGITASSPSGDPLAYRWQESLNNGIIWNDVFDGGIYSGATTQVLQLSTGTTGRKYRTKVTATISGYIIYSPVFTITETVATPLTGTLNPTGFTNCIDPISGTTALTVSPTGGTGAYTYIWETSTSFSGPFIVIPGADENTYTPSLNVAATNYFRVKITSSCYNNTSSVANVTLNGQTITNVTDGTRCNTGTVSLSATASGGTISWFTAESGGAALATGTSYTTASISASRVYYVSTTSSGCTSPRVSVNAIVTSGTTLTSSNFEIIFSSDVCAGSGSSVSMATSGLVNGVYTVNYTISGANSLSSSASVIFNDGYSSFTTGTLSNTGANTLTINNFQIGGCTINVTSGYTSTITVFSGIPDVGDLAVSVTDGCSNIQSIATLTSTTSANGTYVLNYAITGTNSLTSTSQIVFTSGVGTFSLPILNSTGSSNVITIQSISLLSSPTCIAYPGVLSNSFSSNAETTLNSGSDVNICTTTTSANITSGSFASNYNSLIWSTSGTGNFTNNTTIDALTNTYYIPSVADKTAGSVLLTLNATANTGCQNQSRSITFYIKPLSIGGSISGSTTVCTGTNSSTLTLSGHTGSITRWEISGVSNFSSGVITVANTTTTLTITNLSGTRYYRAVVTSGQCSLAYSSVGTINVSVASTAGNVSGGTTVCSGSNSTTLTLTGNTGSIQWQSSTNNITYNNIGGETAATYTATNLTSTTYYKAVVTSGVCGSSTTAAFTLNVVGPSISDPSLASGDYIWKGSSVNSIDSVDWLVPSNWYVFDGTIFNVATSLPTKNINVFIRGINSCFKSNPHIFASIVPVAKNLTILSSGHLTMHTGKLSIARNWVNNGTFTCGTGEAIFIEKGYHTIGGTVSVNAFYDFRMNKPADGGTKSVAYLLKQATIAGTLTLDLGLFDINVFSIDMDDRPVVGGSNASYVRTSSTGFLKRYVGSAYNNIQSGYVRFPVGRSEFNQARLNNGGTSDKFSVRLFDIVSDDAEETSPMTSLPVVERTWIIEEQTIGGSDVDMQLYWNGTVSSRIEELNGFDYNSAYIAHYNANSPTWENKGGSAPSGPGYAQQNGITSKHRGGMPCHC
jgi:hypothetical protein